ASRLVFAGKVVHDEVPPYLAAADILILPYSDAFPDTYVNVGRSSLKLYEYMAMGKPIVASDIGELHESLKDGGGVLVRANDPHLFGREIVALLENDGLMSKFGIEARRRAEDRYNYASLAGEYTKAIESAAR
ncbi:MAG: glycosyltransferase, partial [Chitinivibrionales bacterium]|nr:glycosyltransferase [Chitinivibrionales bacterium]MBD3394352.1 glycosyltransferase [Chitinivibrionales bacterium]